MANLSEKYLVQVYIQIRLSVIQQRFRALGNKAPSNEIAQ